MSHIRHDGQIRENFIKNLCEKKQTSISVSSPNKSSLHKSIKIKNERKHEKYLTGDIPIIIAKKHGKRKKTSNSIYI